MNITINSAEAKIIYTSAVSEKKALEKKIGILYFKEIAVAVGILFIVFFGIFRDLPVVALEKNTTNELVTMSPNVSRLIFLCSALCVYCAVVLGVKGRLIFFRKRMKKCSERLRDLEKTMQENEICFLYDYLFAKKFDDVFLEKILCRFPEIKFE